MRYKDEFHIASTAVLLSMAMFGISVVVPKESRVPTAKTTLTEAPETAAEQAEQAEFPIYSQDSNYDSSYDSSQVDGSYDNSDTDSSDSGQITYPTEDSEDSSGSDTTDNTDIPDYTEDPSEDYGTEDSGDLNYTGDGSGTGSDNRDSSSDTSGQDIEYYE